MHSWGFALSLTPLEACLVNEIELINTAHADPEVRGLRLSSPGGSTRGGDDESWVAGGVNRTEAEGGKRGSRDSTASATHRA